MSRWPSPPPLSSLPYPPPFYFPSLLSPLLHFFPSILHWFPILYCFVSPISCFHSVPFQHSFTSSPPFLNPSFTLHPSFPLPLFYFSPIFSLPLLYFPHLFLYPSFTSLPHLFFYPFLTFPPSFPLSYMSFSPLLSFAALLSFYSLLLALFTALAFLFFAPSPVLFNELLALSPILFFSFSYFVFCLIAFPSWLLFSISKRLNYLTYSLPNVGSSSSYPQSIPFFSCTLST